MSNITKGLQGYMPGVTVQDFGGRPGSDGAQVRIRGATTLGNNGGASITTVAPRRNRSDVLLA